MERPIVSLHVPKTAGSSFAIWLESVFGIDQILRDYGDAVIDPDSPMNVDPAGFLATHGTKRSLPAPFRVVHGHFWARKYENVERAIRITMLRDPVERAVSHYYFWRNLPRRGNSVQRRLIDEDLSLCEFVRLPQISGYYRDHFFRETDMSTFDFIGDSARFDDELSRLEKLLGVCGARAAVNENPAPRDKRQALAEHRGDLTAALAGEIEFYRRYAGR